MERVRLGSLVLTFTIAGAAITIGAAGCSSSNSPAGPGGGSGGHAGVGGGPSVGQRGGASGTGVSGAAGGGGGVAGAGGGVSGVAGTGGGASGVAGTGGGVSGVAGATGTGGQGQPGCAPPAGPAGSWVEIAPPAGQDGFRVTDAFAAGANELMFAGSVSANPNVNPNEARVLRWSQGCWTVELTAAAGASPPFAPSVHGTGPGDVWAVASDIVFHRDAQGWSRFADESWRGMIKQPAPPFSGPVELHRVRAAGANDVWVAASSNILHWSGQAWTAYNFDDPGYPNTSAAIGFAYRDIWIDAPNNVWVAGPSDQIGNTMDLAFVHHFDGAQWTHTATGLGSIEAIWRGGSVLWLANPTQDFINGQQTTLTMRAFDGTHAPAVPMIGTDPNNPPAVVSLFGRGASDIWAAGDHVAHFDGQNWSLISDAPAAALSSNDEHNTYVAGDAGSVWLATPGPHFFRKVTGP